MEEAIFVELMGEEYEGIDSNIVSFSELRLGDIFYGLWPSLGELH